MKTKRSAGARLSVGQLQSVGGYTMDQVVSAAQKAIRRGDEEGALFWVSELDLSGYGGWAWKRLLKVASEDVGIAEHGVVANVRALFENWTDERKRDRDNATAGRLFMVHAVLLLARARKDRRVDHAGIAFWEGERQRRRVPDYALDQHTREGRRLGRGFRHFFDIGAELVNRNDDLGPDPYEAAARAARANRQETDQLQLSVE